MGIPKYLTKYVCDALYILKCNLHLVLPMLLKKMLLIQYTQTLWVLIGPFYKLNVWVLGRCDLV